MSLIVFVCDGLQLIQACLAFVTTKTLVYFTKNGNSSGLCGYFTFVLLVFHRFLRQNTVLRHKCISMYATVLWLPVNHVHADCTHIYIKLHSTTLQKAAIFFNLCYVMQSSLWEVNSSSASQEILSTLLNPNVHFTVHKPRHFSLFSARSIQSMPPHHVSLKSILILSQQTFIGPSNAMFYSSFPIITQHALLFPSMRAA